ncbi:MAG: CARDB domain-containing protein, partial [Synechococcaceae cyanobacterium]|nr:CARDB domain-containing protein [Synechococcaceae cyanobacterium]
LPISIDLNGPDLQVTAASAPASASIGSSINLSWTVKNNGAASANSDWWDGIYLSTDASYDYSDTFITSFSAADISPLAAGSSYTLNKTISTPAISAAGQYHLIFHADSYDNQVEINENNNALALPISIDLNGPDLQVTAASAPASASIGSSINLSWTVKNAGQAATNLYWSDKILLSADSTPDSGDIYLASPATIYPGMSLAAGSTYNQTTTPILPTDLSPGQYFLIVTADGDFRQAEANENNNSFAIPLTVSSAAALPTINVSVSPILVLEDGIAELIFNFSRSGPSSNPLTVYFNTINLTSTAATYGVDFAQTGAVVHSNSKLSVSFSAGASTATVRIDPIADNSQEPDETVSVNLLPDTGYALGLSASAAGTIRDDDALSTIESLGHATLLLRSSDSGAFVKVGSAAPIQVLSPWGATVGSNTSTWQILAADTINGVNKLLWRNNASNFLHDWTLDSTWNWTSSGSTYDPNTAAGWAQESAFLVDANGDGIIGAPYATIEAQGNTTLLSSSNGQAFVQVGSAAPIQVLSPWGATVGADTATWQILAADTINGVNQLLWRNNASNFLHTWTLDSSWNWTASGGVDDPSSPQGSVLLRQFGLS